MSQEKPKDYIHACYSKEVYLRAYNHMIHAVPGMHDWVQSGMEPVAPPLYRRPTGRPKKLRRRETDEQPTSSRVFRRNRKMTCARCLKTGHNTRSCKGPVHPNSRLVGSSSQPMPPSQLASQPMPASQPASQPMRVSKPSSQPISTHRVQCFHPCFILLTRLYAFNH